MNTRRSFLKKTPLILAAPYVLRAKVDTEMAVGNIVFNNYLIEDPDAIYVMYWAHTPEGSFDTPHAIRVEDINGNPIAGKINNRALIPFVIDYHNNRQGSRIPGVHDRIQTVALGLGVACYYSQVEKLRPGKPNQILMVPAMERSYLSP